MSTVKNGSVPEIIKHLMCWISIHSRKTYLLLHMKIPKLSL